MAKEINGYHLSRRWFDWCFENPEKISPNHSAIYFFAIEHCNRLGWKPKFGFPTQMVMDAIGIKKHETYIRYFNDLVEWGFFDLLQRSQNQYSANIISLDSAVPKSGEALGKAIRNHEGKQTRKHGDSNGESNRSIDKPQTSKPLNHKLEIEQFIFNDELFMADLIRSNKGKDLKLGWEQCWIHFSQLPNGLLDWEWKQKFAAWVGRMKIEKNGKDSNGKTKLVQ